MNENKIDQDKVAFFQNEILDWFKKNGRSFPWRKEDLGSYELIIAEVLLQRTRAETVSNKFNSFIEQFTSWVDIDEAKIKELEEVLQPFGLYRQKAKRLKKLSSEMVEEENQLPLVREELENIPLIGQYIASAIISYIHENPAPLLDVNMARVLERFFGPRELADIRYDPYLQELSKMVVNHPEHQKINWGVLDFGALVCTPKNPNCQTCPLRSKCYYYSES